MVEEGDELGLAHVGRMPLPVEEDEPPGPLDLAILGADAVMQATDRHPRPVQELGGIGQVQGSAIPRNIPPDFLGHESCKRDRAWIA